MDPKKLSSEHIKIKMSTPTSEILSYEKWFETKIQAKFDKSDQNFKRPEEELMDFIEQQHQQSEQIEEELFNINSKTPCLSEATEAINDYQSSLHHNSLLLKLLHSLTIIWSA